MVEERLIPKRWHVPELSDTLVTALSQLCFGHNDTIQAVDVLFVFGAGNNLNEQISCVESILEKQQSCTLILTGWVPWYTDSFDTWGIPECKMLGNALNMDRYPDVKVLYEEHSTNTRENVVMSLPLLDRTSVNTIWFVSKAFHAGRTRCTLQTFLPDKILLQYAYDTPIPEWWIVSRLHWHEYEEWRQRVWWEFCRIREYGRNWDIDISSVAWLIDDSSAEVEE